MNIRMIATVCLLAAQCFCAGAGRKVTNTAEGACPIAWSVDTVWEYSSPIALRNAGSVSVRVDSIVAAFDTNKYPNSYLDMITSERYFMYCEWNNGVFGSSAVPLDTCGHCACALTLSAGDSVVVSFDIDASPPMGLPISSAALTKTSTSIGDMMSAVVIAFAGGQCDTLIVMGVQERAPLSSRAQGRIPAARSRVAVRHYAVDARGRVRKTSDGLGRPQAAERELLPIRK